MFSKKSFVCAIVSFCFLLCMVTVLPAAESSDAPDAYTTATVISEVPDAYTSATETYLTGKSGSTEAGEGIMPNSEVKKEIAKLVGGRKHFNLYVLGTSFKNVPATTTAEWAVDNETMTFYGMHEKNTEKLIHIQYNPAVCMSWHEGHFESFSNYRGIQMKGTAELIDGTNPDFDSILINYVPYEDYQAMLGGMPLDAVRNLLKQMMVITKIKMKTIVITNSDFKQNKFRSYQRWTSSVDFSSYTAKPGNKSVTLIWSTTSEASDVTGFNVYRAAEGEDYQKINSTVIASKGAAGGAYTYSDSGLKNLQPYTYTLATVDNETNETWYSPVTATPRWIYGITNK